jgi:hypothetical protein
MNIKSKIAKEYQLNEWHQINVEKWKIIFSKKL